MTLYYYNQEKVTSTPTIQRFANRQALYRYCKTNMSDDVPSTATAYRLANVIKQKRFKFHRISRKEYMTTYANLKLTNHE